MMQSFWIHFTLFELQCTSCWQQCTCHCNPVQTKFSSIDQLRFLSIVITCLTVLFNQFSITTRYLSIVKIHCEKFVFRTKQINQKDTCITQSVISDSSKNKRKRLHLLIRATALSTVQEQLQLNLPNGTSLNGWLRRSNPGSCIDSCRRLLAEQFICRRGHREMQPILQRLCLLCFEAQFLHTQDAIPASLIRFHAICIFQVYDEIYLSKFLVNLQIF